MPIKLCNCVNDASQIYDIVHQRTKVAGRPINKSRSKEEFIQFLLTNTITFGYFDDEELLSFLVTKGLTELPAWHVLLIGTKHRQDKFNIKNSNIPDVIDAALDYWESQNIFSITFVQPRKHRNHINGISIATVSEKMKKYTNPAATLEIIKKGENSKFSLINSLNRDLTFPHDMIVKWSFRLDLFNDLL